MDDISSHVQAAGEHLGRVVQLMHDGVAFREDTKTYNVFSHEGEHLGQLRSADVSYAICFMKRRGRPVGKCTHPNIIMQNGAIEPAFTFAWVGWLVDHRGERI